MSTKALKKATGIDFSTIASTPPQPGDSSSSVKPRTVPGQMMQLAAGQREVLAERVQSLEAEVLRLSGLEGEAMRATQLETELRASQDSLLAAKLELQELDGAAGVRLISPEEIVASKLANRHELSFNTGAFLLLREDIQLSKGNVQPIKVRPLPNSDDGAKYEIVFGHRRHQACLLDGFPVLAMVEELDDREMYVQMERENRCREDVSPWERGKGHLIALEAKTFESLRDLSRCIRRNIALVSNEVALASLPDEVVAAFPSPLLLQYRMTKPLQDALDADRDAVIRRALEIVSSDKKMAPGEILRELVAGAQNGKGRQRFELRTSTRRLGALEISPAGLSVKLRKGALTGERLSELGALVKAFIEA